MPARFRRLLAILSVLAGGFLVIVEFRGLVTGGGFEEVFWMLIGALMLLLGGAEFLPGSTDEPRD